MRILFLTHRLPYAANRGDRVRALNLLRVLAPRADVDLVSLVHTDAEAAHAADLRHLTSSVTVLRPSRVRGYTRAVAALAAGRPLTHALLHAAGAADACRQIVERRRPDLVFSYCSGMAPLALSAPLDALPLVLDMVDVDSAKWAALAAEARAPWHWIYGHEARTMAAFEAVAARHARTTVVVNERERDALLRLAPSATVRAVPNGVETGPRRAPAAEPRVTFCGVMDYPPNVHAVVWFAEQVWPLVRRRRPDAAFTIVGSDPARAVRRLVRPGNGVVVTGAVPDPRPYLSRSAVAVAPLWVARGVQNKVLEAIAAGLPCVITPAVERGLPTQVLPACRVAGDADAFAHAVAGLLDRTPEERRAIAAAADLASLSWDERLAPVIDIVERAAASARAAADVA